MANPVSEAVEWFRPADPRVRAGGPAAAQLSARRDPAGDHVGAVRRSSSSVLSPSSGPIPAALTPFARGWSDGAETRFRSRSVLPWSAVVDPADGRHLHSAHAGRRRSDLRQDRRVRRTASSTRLDRSGARIDRAAGSDRAAGPTGPPGPDRPAGPDSDVRRTAGPRRRPGHPPVARADRGQRRSVRCRCSSPASSPSSDRAWCRWSPRCSAAGCWRSSSRAARSNGVARLTIAERRAAMRDPATARLGLRRADLRSARRPIRGDRRLPRGGGRRRHCWRASCWVDRTNLPRVVQGQDLNS